MQAAWEAASVWNASLDFDISNEYPPVSALYPWRVVEPHRATTLTAVSGLTSQNGIEGGSGQRYSWEVTLGGHSLLPNTTLARGAASVVYVFERPAKEYTVRLTEESVGRKGELHVRSITASVMCKYVRREIRQLTTEDRIAYFEAMETLAKTDMETGVATYGERFVNLQYMTKKHLYGDSCTPYHSGNSFFTAHAAFTLQLDQVRCVDGSGGVARPRPGTLRGGVGCGGLGVGGFGTELLTQLIVITALPCSLSPSNEPI